jgi:murein DD-endopeptidase MepM/ murein hydrolase activator NlpD
MTYPTDTNYPITQDYGDTELTKKRGSEIYSFFNGKHPGIDIKLPIGTSVYSCLEGIVTSREYHRGMGKVLRIRTGNLLHIYAHLDSFDKDYGDKVVEGELIAKSGNSVVWTEPHLHFEIRDLTIYEVNERPFKPGFCTGFPKQYKNQFEYICNHNEALIDLALKYYGTEQGINILLSNNPDFKGIHTHKSLELGTKIIIE